MINTLIDAGPVIALFDRDDQHHDRVLAYMQNFEGRLITTWPVLTEVCYMLDFNTETQLDFLRWVNEGGIEVHNLEQWEISGIRNKMAKYADLPADFADASLLQVAESRSIRNILTIDGDFNICRTGKGRILNNLLSGN